eukprot:g79570.t1
MKLPSSSRPLSPPREEPLPSHFLSSKQRPPPPFCALCTKQDDLRNLNPACICYKKSESTMGLIHISCLQQLLTESENVELPCCSQCGKPYQISIKYRFLFSWSRCLRCRSLAHVFDMCIVLFMLGCGGFSMLMFRNRPVPTDTRGKSQDSVGEVMVYVLFAITMCLMPLTMRKVFERWRQANADAEVSLV